MESATKKVVLFGIVCFLPAGAPDPGIERLPTLNQKEVSRGLVPQEYLYSGTGQAAPDPRLVKEIAAFMEKNQMFGGLPVGVVSDLLTILNVPVQKYLHAFAKSKHFQAFLARSGRYLLMMPRIFAEHGLPQDLVYIVLLESGFSPYARSPKDAVGIYQFIGGTGQGATGSR